MEQKTVEEETGGQTQPTIRRATLADVEALSELGARTFTDTFGHLYTPEDLAHYLSQAYNLERTRADLTDPAKALWLAETAGGVPIGFALAGPCALPHPEVTPECGELKRLYVLQGHQNNGIGRRLFVEALEWLQTKDCARTIWIGVWSGNHGAQRFYARHGFQKVGEYGFQVGDQIDHEFIMARRATENTLCEHSSSE